MPFGNCVKPGRFFLCRCGLHTWPGLMAAALWNWLKVTATDSDLHAQQYLDEPLRSLYTSAFLHSNTPSPAVQLQEVSFFFTRILGTLMSV